MVHYLVVVCNNLKLLDIPPYLNQNEQYIDSTISDLQSRGQEKLREVAGDGLRMLRAKSVDVFGLAMQAASAANSVESSTSSSSAENNPEEERGRESSGASSGRNTRKNRGKRD